MESLCFRKPPGGCPEVFLALVLLSFCGGHPLKAQSDEEIVESQGGKVIDATKIAQEKMNHGITITNTQIQAQIALNSQQRLLQEVEQSEAKLGANAVTNQARKTLSSTSSALSQDGAATQMSADEYAALGTPSETSSGGDTGGGPTTDQTAQWQNSADATKAFAAEDALGDPNAQDGDNVDNVKMVDPDGNEYDANGDPTGQNISGDPAANAAPGAATAANTDNPPTPDGSGAPPNGSTTAPNGSANPDGSASPDGSANPDAGTSNGQPNTTAVGGTNPDGSTTAPDGTKVYPTTYAQNEGTGAGTTGDQWTNENLSSLNKNLTVGTIAVDPNKFPYGTHYTVPDNPTLNATLIANGAPTTPDGRFAILTSGDTGSAVVKGTAASENGYSGTPVVDVYAGRSSTQYRAVQSALNDKPITLVPYRPMT